MSITIYHNPDCGTSRNVLAILREFADEPQVVHYLDEGWNRAQLSTLLADAGLSPREALRVRKSPAEEMGLTDESVEDEIIFEAMLDAPILVNRPLVVTPKGTALCRPSEAVFALLGLPSGTNFTKEDGQTVTAA